MSSCCRGTGHLCRLVVVPVSRHRRSCRRWRAAVALATHVILSLSSDRGPQSKYCNWTGRERDNGDGTVNNGNTSQQGAASWDKYMPRSHAETARNVLVGSSDPGVDAESRRRDLHMLIKRMKASVHKVPRVLGSGHICYVYTGTQRVTGYPYP